VATITLLQKFKLGIPIRDMRLLDPNLLTSETGKILVRENAIVFAMEHIRLIISATTVIIPRDGFEQNLLNSRFNALLEESIIEASQEKQHRESRLAHLREIAESDIDDDTSSGKPCTEALQFCQHKDGFFDALRVLNSSNQPVQVSVQLCPIKSRCICVMVLLSPLSS